MLFRCTCKQGCPPQGRPLTSRFLTVYGHGPSSAPESKPDLLCWVPVWFCAGLFSYKMCIRDRAYARGKHEKSVFYLWIFRDLTHIPPIQTCEMTDFPQKGITRYQSEILVVPLNWCYLFRLSERVRGRRHSALVTPSACPAIRPEAGMPAAGRSRAAYCPP